MESLLPTPSTHSSVDKALEMYFIHMFSVHLFELLADSGTLEKLWWGFRLGSLHLMWAKKSAGYIVFYVYLIKDLTHWIWMNWQSCHERIWMRSSETGICYDENFNWWPGWKEWLIISAQMSWRKTRLSGNIGRGCCINSMGKP